MVVQEKVASLLYQRLHWCQEYPPTTHTHIPESVDVVDLPMDDISVSFHSKQNIPCFQISPPFYGWFQQNIFGD